MLHTALQLALKKVAHHPNDAPLGFWIIGCLLHTGRLPLHMHQTDPRRLDSDSPSTLGAKAINVVEHVSAFVECGRHDGGLHAVD